MVRRSKNDTEFGASVSSALAEAHLTANELAARTGLSSSYLNQMMTGRKRVSPEWADLIASTLDLQGKERKKLHAAAVTDMGYDVDLTKE
jgi:plasmid maintenance system antidote protein VapI